jgi:hypothetical protein
MSVINKAIPLKITAYTFWYFSDIWYLIACNKLHLAPDVFLKKKYRTDCTTVLVIHKDDFYLGNLILAVPICRVSCVIPESVRIEQE